MPRQRSVETTQELEPIQLERLTGLVQFIDPDTIEQVLHESGCRNRSDCRLTHQVMLLLVLAMGILTDLPLPEVFRHCRRFRFGQVNAKRAALCRARQRLGVAPVRRLLERLAQPLAQPGLPGCSYRGLHLVGIDGTVLDVPDSDANARVFGRPAGGRGDGAFPQVRKLSLVELSTHAELAVILKPLCRGEGSMVAALLRHLHAGMLLMCDRNFFSHALWRELLNRQVDVLFRVKKNLVLEPTEQLSDGSYLAKIYPCSRDRQADRNGIVVRVIQYTLDDPKRVGHGEVHTLLSTLRDSKEYPALELILLYHERWEHELTYDEQKTHQAPRCPGKEAQLRSETPAGVIQEIYALSLAHYITRALMAEAAVVGEVEPTRLSFMGCLRILRLRMPDCQRQSRDAFQRWYQGLIWEMAQELLPSRRHRVNPRVVKRKMSKFAKKRPKHRPVPPLTKPFAETIVLLV